MTQEMKTKIKEVLESAMWTFLTVFLLAVLPYVSDITFEGLKNGAFAGIVIAGLRVALKEALVGVIQFIKSLKK
jgi:hypothetical protein